MEGERGIGSLYYISICLVILVYYDEVSNLKVMLLDIVPLRKAQKSKLDAKLKFE